MDVRDYECDVQGIVNNANYLHYAEHTRHRFLNHIGLRFVDMHDEGLDFVVARMTLQYKAPLHGNDTFISRLAVRKEGVRYVFHHAIYREQDERLCFTAKAELVCLDHGKLAAGTKYDHLFEPYYI